jgi:hypothetical protein
VKKARRTIGKASVPQGNLHPAAHDSVEISSIGWPLVGANPDFPTKRYDNSLPYWSKMQRPTIHKKTAIDPTSADKGETAGVADRSLALSETVNRKLAAGRL